MKKLLMIVLSLILLTAVFPISASAEEALKAPTVQYKIVNHDKVSLKWNKIDGAESYYIYMRNDKTGKYTKKYEVKSNAVTLKKLSPDTEYSYAVVAVKDGVKSRSSNKVTFTTPSEWYYYIDNDYSNYYELAEIDIYRHHYDGNGKEKFPVDFMLEPLEKYYSTDEFELRLKCQYEDYVYFTVLMPSSDSSEEFYYDIWRIKNDGSSAEYFSMGSSICELYFDSKNNAYACSRFMWEDDDIGDYVFVYNVWCNDEFLYSADMAAFVVGNDCIFASEYSSYDSNRSKIVQIYPDGSDVQTFLTEADNVSIDPVFCDDNYLYYLKRTIIGSQRKEELCRVKLNDTNNVQNIYTFGSVPQYAGYRKYDLELINGYIYFHWVWDDCYYRMKADGTGLTKSDKPFEWRY